MTAPSQDNASSFTVPGWTDFVPPTWQLRPLGALFAVVNGGTPESAKGAFWDGEVIWVTPEDISRATSGVLNSSRRTITEVGRAASGLTPVPEGSIILTTRAPIGNVALAGTPLTTNQGCKALISQGEVLPKFAFYVLLQATRELQMLGRGTTFLELSTNKLKSFKIPLPPRDDQEAIVGFLDHATAKLDGLRDKQTQMLGLIGAKRLALIAQAVTRGLGSGAAVTTSGVAWVGDVPTHWAVEPIGARYEVQLGKMLDQKQAKGDAVRPYLRNTNVQWGRIDMHDLLTMEFDEAERRKFALRPGDLLVCEGGDVGRAALWEGQVAECYYQKALHRLRPFREGDNPRFLYYLMFTASKLGVFVANGNKSTIMHLTAVKLRRTRMPFPPAAEQNAIVDFLDMEIGKLDELAGKIRCQLDLVREHRAALITAAVTGQIDVRAAREETP